MRKTSDWLQTYQNFMFNTEPAAAFDKWTAYYVIAAALRKKISLSLGRIKIYPNVYIVFVAEPGRARKSQAISYGIEFMSNIPEIITSADAITKEAMLQDLENCCCDELMVDGTVFKHSSLNITSKEFESFLGQKKENTKMLVLLTDLFDCQELPWKYRTKNSGTNIVPSVFLNLLAATTPESLASSLPPTAVGGGLTSRILFVWADNKKKKIPRPVMTEEEKQMKQDLIDDLFVISRMSGRYEMDAECMRKWDKWYMEFDEDSPHRICRDPSFNGWYSRKPLYILKIAMIIAASQSNSLEMKWEYMAKAIKEIEELERSMGNVFKAIGKSTVVSEVENVAQLIKDHVWISEPSLMRLAYRDNDSAKFDNVISTVLRTGQAKREFRGPNGEINGIWYRWVR